IKTAVLHRLSAPAAKSGVKTRMPLRIRDLLKENGAAVQFWRGAREQELKAQYLRSSVCASRHQTTLATRTRKQVTESSLRCAENPHLLSANGVQTECRHVQRHS